MNAGGRIRRTALTTALAAVALGGLAAGSARADTQSFTQATQITFPDLGNANPMPSQLAVAGLKGTVTKVQLHLEDFTSSNPNDIDLLLVSPDNRAVVPLSDAGFTTDVAGLDMDFVDTSNDLPSLGGPLVSGTYKPTDYDTNEPGPGFGAPDPPYAPLFSAFNGINGNGTWKLYGFSDFFNGGGSSSIDEWRLTLTTEAPDLTLSAKKQWLGGKLKVFATSTTDATLTLGGQVKPKTLSLSAGVRTAIKVKVKPAIRKRLAGQLDPGEVGKLKVKGTATDVTGAADTAKVKAKVRG